MPQRKSPLLGLVASWSSRKVRCVLRFGLRYFDSIPPVMRLATGLTRNGALVLTAGCNLLVVFAIPGGSEALELKERNKTGYGRDPIQNQEKIHIKKSLLFNNRASTRKGIMLPSA